MIINFFTFSEKLTFIMISQEEAPRKFLVIGGVGAGIGNFLIFFPAAYYFAALTGREILVADDSLIGEYLILYSFLYQHGLKDADTIRETEAYVRKSSKRYEMSMAFLVVT
jgi:hypothetical protein